MPKTTTIRKKVLDKKAGKVRIYQEMNRKKNKFARIMKNGKPTERQAILAKMTSWQTSQMMKWCNGKIREVSDEKLKEFASMKKGSKANEKA